MMKLIRAASRRLREALASLRAGLNADQVWNVLYLVALSLLGFLAGMVLGVTNAIIGMEAVAIGWLLANRRELLDRCDAATDASDRALASFHAIAAELEGPPMTGRHARSVDR